MPKIGQLVSAAPHMKDVLHAGERCRSFYDGIKRNAEHLASMHRAIESSLAPFRLAGERLADFQREILEHSAPLREFARKQREFHDQFRRSLEKIDDDNAWLLKMGWPPLMHAPLNAARRLRRHCNALSPKKARTKVDHSIVEFYDEPRIRKDILTEWERKTFLKRRMAILRSAVEAHIRGDCPVSIPALLAQTEGIVVDYFGHRGWLGWDTYKGYVREMLDARRHSSSGDLYRQFLLDVVLANFVHGESVTRGLNRHAILHGADTTYATPANSLKAVLVLDFLLRQVHFVSLESSQIYHRPECARILRTQQKRRVHGSEVLAQAHGLRPCQSCRPGDG